MVRMSDVATRGIQNRNTYVTWIQTFLRTIRKFPLICFRTYQIIRFGICMFIFQFDFQFTVHGIQLHLHVIHLCMASTKSTTSVALSTHATHVRNTIKNMRANISFCF